MLVIPQGYAQVLHSISLFGDPEALACTYGVKFAEVDPPSLTVLADFLHDRFIANLQTHFSSDYALEATTVRYTTGETGNPQGVEIHVERNPFTGNLDPIPQNSAVLIRKRSGLAGRRRQGRLYLPPPPETAVSPVGRLTTGYRDALQTSVNSWLASINTSANLQGPYILHSTGLSAVPPPTSITSMTVEPTIATQRRRLRP